MVLTCSAAEVSVDFSKAEMTGFPKSVLRESSTVVRETTNWVGFCNDLSLDTEAVMDVFASCESDDDDASGLGYAVKECCLSVLDLRSIWSTGGVH